MPNIKLQRLPDRTPVELTISVSPALADDLNAYAKVYHAAYGYEEAIIDLIPAMLTAFLGSDRTFQKDRVRSKRELRGRVSK